MGASSFRGQSPFLIYLTVFKARLGATNIVLPLTGFAYQSVEALSRRLKGKLSQLVTLEVAAPGSAPIFEYLLEKKLVSAEARKTGRYTEFSLLESPEGWVARDRAGQSLSKVAVFQTDVWLADPAIQSTIGVPTSENSGEVLELCFQLGLISKIKCTWTAAGQLTHGLRGLSAPPADNPMVLGLEAVALLRQVIAKDGLLLRELLRELQRTPTSLSRDEFALRLPHLAERALKSAQELRMPPPALAEGKQFVTRVKTTATKRSNASRAPGVLEHRITPRLEWLTDFGVLSKHGMPRNGFEYFVTSDAGTLLKPLERNPAEPYWAEDAALTYWRVCSWWADARSRMREIELQEALRRGYRVMQRSVGPTSIRDVCFAAGVLAPRITLGMAELSSQLVDWASQERRITVSGGRYSRAPELVHMTADVLEKT